MVDGRTGNPNFSGPVVPSAGAAQILQGLFTPQGTDDPYPVYARLHERGEVFLAGDTVFVAGYEAVGAVLRDPAFLVHGAAEIEKAYPDWRQHPSLSLSVGSLLNLDGADHSRVRGLLSSAFSRRRVASLAPVISQVSSRLLRDMASSGSAGEPVEFMNDFAYLFPATVIGELIGVPESDRGAFRPLAQAVLSVGTAGDGLSGERLAAADTAARTLNDYFTRLAAERRRRPRDDLISALVAASEPAGERLSEPELLDNLNILLLAGFVTTSNLLGNGLRILLDDSGLLDALRAGVVSATGFTEEVLRYDAPVQWIVRRSPFGAEIGGVQITPGQEVVLLLGAANRDPAQFALPDDFRPARAEGPPLSFGAGAHFCLGSALARLEASIAFPMLLSRFPVLAAAGDPVRDHSSFGHRGFASLPIRVGR